MIPKYRAWHIHKQIMCEVIRIDFKQGIVTLDLEPDDDEYYWTETDWNTSHVTLMQSTGLFDKTGKEIFEGDILSVKHTTWMEPTIHTVRWGGADYPAFDLQPTLDDEMNSLSLLKCSGFYEYEIIGNIYENPELLEVSHD